MTLAGRCGRLSFMARHARVAPGGLVYHVLNRSVGPLPLFRKPADYEAFERVLVEAQARAVIAADWPRPEDAGVGVFAEEAPRRHVEVLERRSHDTTDEVKRNQCGRQIRAAKAEEERELWLRRLRDQAFVQIKK